MKLNQKKFPIYTEVTAEAKTIYKLVDARVFDFPFFNDGINELNRNHFPSEKFELENANEFDNVNLLEIKGFIFHTSHCGSTLLANI